MSVFKTLSTINVNDHIEKKNGLSYLSWAWAWAELKKQYPDSLYTVYENENGFNYHTDGKTGWVKVGVTVEEVEIIEYLPIMNYRNQSILLNEITSMDVTKAIQRCATKAIGRHGLGLYIYAGEDLPEAPPEPPPELLTDAQLKKINTLLTELGIDRNKVKERFGVASLKELWKVTATKLIDDLEKVPKPKGE